jgi:DNA-binding transcriptional ArsR family regulator
MATEDRDERRRGLRRNPRFEPNHGRPKPTPPTAIAPALSHATRRRVLRRLNGSGDVRSTSELAAEFGLSLSLVAYHFAVLCDSGLIWVEGWLPVRGARETFYRSLVAEVPQVKVILTATETEDEGEAQERGA